MLERDDVLQEALALPPADRAFVVVALEQSLTSEDDALAEANGNVLSGMELLQELRRRSESYQAGHSRAWPAAEVLADIRQRLADETNA
jgi:putative addiction module component (TIGR02574 family)